MDIRTRRAYDDPGRDDGYRILIDRLWPRGVAKADLALDEWDKELAPSDDLRKWFGHDPEKWDEFRKRYRKELDDRQEAVAALVKRAAKGRVTLVFGARDEKHSNAEVLRDYLTEKAG
ncbi:DUF488 domain-containing protein [Pontibaca methylaminivorans]|uniref:Uncharacterized conserved protein YeaO, DUF488 family n=1 Tax=Pontibaca methylaminivorans TaxID=515897 RepID=A0A1R3WI69_9RHOB|nr:DUF488 domain-containing protein [Pontibaca methylaminivorans]SIT76954.1 Uncharacterized conserved protein YeaO, DUF488 family [Pontibaca methylaminivorans]